MLSGDKVLYKLMVKINSPDYLISSVCKCTRRIFLNQGEIVEWTHTDKLYINSQKVV